MAANSKMQMVLSRDKSIIVSNDKQSPVTSARQPSMKFITFRVSRRRREMYCGRAHLCVCACLSVRGRMPTLLHGPGCNLGSGRRCPLVVHYWADLQSVHGLRCYGNITPRTRNVSEYMLVLVLCLVHLIIAEVFGRPLQVTNIFFRRRCRLDDE